MGQNASKVAKSVASKVRTPGGSGPSATVGASASQATQGLDTKHAHPSPPLPETTSQRHPFISERQGTETPVSTNPLAHPAHEREAAQQRFLEEQAGGAEYQEMPPDLLDFLKDAGPLQKRKAGGPPGTNAGERKMRLPRHLREDRADDGSSDVHQPETASTHPESSPLATEFNDQRRVESMRLVESIPGFEVSRTTNFSTKPAVNEEKDPSIFKSSEVVDIFEMIMLNRQRSEEGKSEEEVVQEIYRNYAKKYAVPEDETGQERHKKLLRSTLSFLDNPVIMKDNDGTFDGARPDQVKDLEMLGGVVVPKTIVKAVLEDFSDMKRKV